jgi:LPXTG-motif cell wall-anchored protein
MDTWIWIGIVVVVLGIAWLSLRKKKNTGYTPISSSGGLWDKVKDACCIRNR